MNDILTVADVANLAGISRRGVTQAIRRGKLHADKFGDMWMINADEFRKWMIWREMPRSMRREDADETQSS